MTRVPPHPAEYSPEVLAVFTELIEPGEHVHDPFAGRALRLGPLCDRLGVTFTGTDREQYDGADPRVAWGNSADPSTYPPRPFTVVTSPIYLNGISSDYKEGPKPGTNLDGRLAYGISLGHALHPDNFARSVVRSRADKGASVYYPRHATAVKHWGDRVIVNVDAPMEADWRQLLIEHGYVVVQVIPVLTGRYRNGANRDVRADHEVVIEARRSSHG